MSWQAALANLDLQAAREVSRRACVRSNSAAGLTCIGPCASFPNMGVSREELKTALRSQPVGNYLIFYFPLEDGVDIIRVLHGSRDMARLF